jgi:hypothetical protein
VPADGVDLVDEDDAGRVLLALHEEVADARGADADEHLDEVGAGDREERHAGLARDGAREERLAGSRRADEQHALGNAAAELRELLRVLQEGDDLFELFLRLFDAGDVAERDLVLVLGQQLRAALAERHGLAAADLHLAHEEDPHADESSMGAHCTSATDVPGLVVLGLRLDVDALLAELRHERRILGRERLEVLAGPALLVLVLAADVLALDVTAATLPSSTAWTKRVKLISVSRGCCFVTIDQKINPKSSRRSHKPRFRDTGVKGASVTSVARRRYHTVF